MRALQTDRREWQHDNASFAGGNNVTFLLTSFVYRQSCQYRPRMTLTVTLRTFKRPVPPLMSRRTEVTFITARRRRCSEVSVIPAPRLKLFTVLLTYHVLWRRKCEVQLICFLFVMRRNEARKKYARNLSKSKNWVKTLTTNVDGKMAVRRGWNDLSLDFVKHW